jgi:hypothetical protein
MSDLYPLTAPRVDAQGADLTQISVQLAFNQLAGAVRIYLNQIAAGTIPTGPAGGDLSGTYPNPTVAAVHAVAGTIDGVVIGGVVPEPGSFTTLAGTSVFASGGAIPPVTTTGTQIYNSPNPTIQFIDTIRSAGNKNAYVQWGATVLAFGFANDTFTGFTNALTITGGQAVGISGITSTSGTGVWAHTGGFSATGGINSTSVGLTTPAAATFTALSSTSGALNGTIGATTPASGAFTTVSATTPIGVASGGTGRATLTAHGVLVGEGTTAINQTAVGTTGQMLLGVTGADPAFGNNPTITGGTINGAAIGGVTPAAGAFTTVSATGTISPSTTAGIVGTKAGDDANAGSVGEFVTASASSVALTSGVVANVVSISLTAGDWDVSGVVGIVGAGTTTFTSNIGGSSATSATLGPLGSYWQAGFGLGTGSTILETIPTVRYNVTTTTTIFAVALSSFSVSTATGAAVIRARRIR